MKDKIIAFWNNKALPFLKDETAFRNWAVIVIGLVSFILGAWVF